MKSVLTYLEEWAIEPWKKNIIDIVINDKEEEISKILDEIIHIIETKNYIYEQNEGIPESTNLNKVIIKKISSPTNINALAEDVFFELGEGLNVFFGENGSGKSSYVRVFRKLAENYYTSKKNLNILPNVYKNAFSTYKEQKLDVTYKIGDTQLIETIDINEIHPTLSKINVFDSDSVYPLIDKELAFKVLPKGFEYFEKAAQLIDKLKVELKARIKNLNQESENIFNSIIYDAVKEELEIIFNSLHSSSQVQHYLSFNYPFTKDDVQKKKSTEILIKELESTNPESKIKLLVLQKSRLQAIIRNLNEFAETLTQENIKNINSIISEYGKKLEEERVLNEAYKSNISYLSIVNDEWLAFINKGVNYFNSINKENIFEGDACIFCSNPLNQQAVTTIQNHIKHSLVDSCFHANINSTIERYTLKTIVKKVEQDELYLFENERLIEKIKITLELIEKNVILFNEKIGSKRIMPETLILDLSPLILQIESEIICLDERIELLKSDKEKILGHVNQLNNELKDYKKRELINNLEEKIKKGLEIRKEKLFYERLVKDFNTTKLTQKQKQAFQEIVQDEYLQQFAIYAEKLNTPYISIGLLPKKGRTLRAKYILSDKYNISSVMSEGEQKAIAMVEFSTDIKMRNDYSSVLFDDPVTSLDYKRTEKFAELIYELSLERQVIVFTHDIMFYYYLYNACVKDKNKENKFFKIDAFDKLNKGIVSESFSGKIENLKDVMGKINNQYQLINSRRILGDNLEETLKKVYSDIRTWCELVVEEGFFKSVIRRYEPNIRFTKVKDIKSDFVEDLKKVSNLFDKSCRWMAGHSQPIGTQYNKPTVEVFNEDYQFIKEIFESYK